MKQKPKVQDSPRGRTVSITCQRTCHESFISAELSRQKTERTYQYNAANWDLIHRGADLFLALLICLSLLP